MERVKLTGAEFDRLMGLYLEAYERQDMFANEAWVHADGSKTATDLCAAWNGVKYFLGDILRFCVEDGAGGKGVRGF